MIARHCCQCGTGFAPCSDFQWACDECEETTLELEAEFDRLEEIENGQAESDWERQQIEWEINQERKAA